MNDLNIFFHANTFDGRDSKTYKSVVEKYVKNYQHKTNAAIISEIYGIMLQTYRNEYIYQNEFFNSLNNNDVVLSQFRTGKSKADLVVLGDTATVYEIKSELDGFERLKTQINDYYKVFGNVAVLTHENAVGKLKSFLGIEVGISVLTKDRKFEIVRKPMENYSALDHLTMFKSLRKMEFEAIIMEKFGYLPQVSQVFYHDACFGLFSKVPSLSLTNLLANELRKRKIINVDNIPYELKSLVYFSHKLAKKKNFDSF